MSKSGITWTDKTWSPVTGCTKVSAGCKNCYAEREVQGRWSKNPKSVFFGRSFTDVRCHEDQLKVLVKWRKPYRIFVCPRGDLFHESVPFEFIDRVFAAMALNPQHTFQVLTKRPERMLEYLIKTDTSQRIAWAVTEMAPPKIYMKIAHDFMDPLPNVWIGVTVENQEAANERIDLLRKVPAAIRFLSVEPMLGHIETNLTDIDWVICGGESGTDARPMHPDWVRALRDQCAEAGVPFLFKQWGEWAPHQARAGGDEGGDLRRGHVRYLQGDGREPDGHFRKGDAAVAHIGKKAAGRMLDGVLHEEYPESRGVL